MEFLASLFVGEPIHIAIVSLILFGGYMASRQVNTQNTYHPYALLITSLAWGIYAVWEWLVQIETSEANIRADLLLIWPILALLLVWSLWQMFKAYINRP